MFSSGIESVLQRSERVLKGEFLPLRDKRFDTYAAPNPAAGTPQPRRRS